MTLAVGKLVGYAESNMELSRYDAVKINRVFCSCWCADECPLCLCFMVTRFKGQSICFNCCMDAVYPGCSVNYWKGVDFSGDRKKRYGKVV